MGDFEWQPIETAPKDGTPVLARIRSDLATHTGRDDHERLQGLWIVVRHTGVASDGFDSGWQLAGPFGQGGFSDDWFSGWYELPPEEQNGS
jgi:hypothetical protein